MSASFTVDAVLTCLSETTRNFVVCTNVTLALILLICYSHWWIKKPAKENPFSLTYKVLKYAVKNKHPQCRSAFTYCEDELPSRIDFGKSKYGGPFTTEQVEDVKTFLRLIPMAIVGGALTGGMFATNYFRNSLINLITATSEATEFGRSISVSLKECYFQTSFSHTIYYSTVILIVLHEAIFYPVFHRCVPQIESLQKVLIGMLLQITQVLVLITYIIILRHTSKEQLQCLFSSADHNIPPQTITFSRYWIAILDFLQALSITMLQIGVTKFLSPQVPHFMKGLMIGMTCCFLFISSAIWFVLSIPFTVNSTTWGSGVISCGFWFSLIIATTQICTCPILIILTRWYKKRR